ncbi:hypothetical protein PO124_21720 [Bacillus licheniformis]|nr:hypothetical protein [Bacillus licheniformis]
MDYGEDGLKDTLNKFQMRIWSLSEQEIILKTRNSTYPIRM